MIWRKGTYYVQKKTRSDIEKMLKDQLRGSSEKTIEKVLAGISKILKQEAAASPEVQSKIDKYF